MKSEKFHPYEALNKRGLAVGESNIKDDTMTFVFYGEQFTFPTLDVFRSATFNGYFYTAPVDKLRALQKKK